jgi:hypothetical protein
MRLPPFAAILIKSDAGAEAYTSSPGRPELERVGGIG